MLPPSIDTPLPIRITPPFLQEDLEHPPFYDFSKILTPYK